MDNEAALLTIVEGVSGWTPSNRGADQRCVHRRVVGDSADRGTCVSVPPRSGHKRRAIVEVMPDHAYSTYIGVGVGGWIEVFTTPKDPTGGVTTVLQLVEVMVAGRLQERVWRHRGADTRVSSLLYLQMESGGRWRTAGRMNRPLPLLRRWRYEEQTVEYDAY